MRYLHSHVHGPLFYPRQPIGPPQTITYNLANDQSMSYQIRSTPTGFVDSTFGNITPDRRSTQSENVTVNCVIVAWSSTTQRSIAKDSTDAEIKAVFHMIPRIISMRNFIVSSALHHLIPLPAPLFIDNTATI